MSFAKKNRTSILANLLMIVLPVAVPGLSVAYTQEWRELGLLRVRDMTPFGLTRLDFLPAHAVNAPPGTFAVEANMSYQNTWARSDNVARYLENRGGPRSELTSTDVAAILALPGDAYLVDGEYGLVDLTLHYRASEHFGLYATVPYVFFNVGVLDHTIESFHDSFGFDNSGRERVLRNRWQTILQLEQTTTVLNRAPHDDFGDPVFGLRYSLHSRPTDWNLIFETALKLPRAGRRPFVSTGNTDYGVQLSLQRFFTRNAFYLTLSGVDYASPDIGMARNQWIPTAILGWETRLTEHSNFVLQLYTSRSTVQETNLHELSANKLQISAGWQWLHRGHVLRFGLTENIRNFNNTPDVGLTLSVGRIFYGH